MAPGDAWRQHHRRVQPFRAAGRIRRRGLACRAKPVDGGYRITGSKAWITNGGKADFYTLFARTADTGSKGISCFLVPAGTEGLSFGKPEEKMGLHAIPTTSAHYDDAFVPAERRIGVEGQGLPIAFSALDSGRLGIAAVATGLAQAALDEATAYAKERQAFGKRIIDTRPRVRLADMAAAVDSAVPPISTPPGERTPACPTRDRHRWPNSSRRMPP